MREIKFRGMSVNCKWHYGLLSHTENSRVCPDIGWFICNSEGSPFAYQVRPETVGQFTGLHDVKGTEIYEGDILLCDDEGESFGQKYDEAKDEYIPTDRFAVVFGEECPAFTLDGYDGDWNPFTIEAKFEVVGNIFENPELLSPVVKEA